MFGFGYKDPMWQGHSRIPLWENTAEEGKWGGQGAGGEQVYSETGMDAQMCKLFPLGFAQGEKAEEYIVVR